MSIRDFRSFQQETQIDTRVILFLLDNQGDNDKITSVLNCGSCWKAPIISVKDTMSLIVNSADRISAHLVLIKVVCILI